MEAFAVLVTIAVVGFVVAGVASSQRRSTVNAAWREAAVRRSLLFKPAEFLSGPEIVGTVHGCQARVDTVTHGGQNAQKYTRFRASYPWPLELGLALKEASRMTGVAKLLGSQDIETGDPEFDRAIVVKGTDHERVRQFLTAVRRSMIRDLFDALPGANITDTEIRWEVRDVIGVPGKILDPLDRMLDLAQAFVLEPDADRERTADSTLELDVAPIGSDALLTEISVASESSPDTLAQRLAPSADGPEDRIPTVDVPTVSEATPADTLTPQMVSEALFGGSILSYERAQVFADRFRGRRVQWSGTLVSAAHYPFDRVFGSAPGTKAVVKIHETAAPAGRRSIQAILQLPRESLTQIRRSQGTAVAFEGDLVECDGFMNSLYVADGRILWVGER